MRRAQQNQANRRTYFRSLSLSLLTAVFAAISMSSLRAQQAAPPEEKEPPLLERAFQAAQRPDASLTTFALARRVAVLKPSLPAVEDPMVRRILSAVRRQRRRELKGRRFGDVLKSALPALDPPPKNGTKNEKSIRKQAEEQAAEEVEKATPEQLRAAATQLFYEALIERLRTGLSVAVTTDEEMKTALTTLKLSPQEAAKSEGGKRLAASLHADALLIPTISGFSLQEGMTRDVSLWADFRVLGSVVERTASSPTIAPGGTILILPPGAFSVGSTGTIGHMLFQMHYAKPRYELAWEAAQEAAALAIRTLRTGEVGPFMQRGAHVALAPLLIPNRMDKLIFTPTGRKVQTAGLPAKLFDASLVFNPDLHPVFPQDILPPESLEGLLQSERRTSATLWKRDDVPDVVHAQALGKRLGVDYVLLARISYIEVDEGPLDLPTGLEAERPRLKSSVLPANAASAAEIVERKARAEAVGALVQVRSGAILWNDRATATMTARSLLNGKPIPLRTEAEVARDAVRFALIQLQRNFHQYRAGFAR